MKKLLSIPLVALICCGAQAQIIPPSSGGGSSTNTLIIPSGTSSGSGSIFTNRLLTVLDGTTTTNRLWFTNASAAFGNTNSIHIRTNASAGRWEWKTNFTGVVATNDSNRATGTWHRISTGVIYGTTRFDALTAITPNLPTPGSSNPNPMLITNHDARAIVLPNAVVGFANTASNVLVYGPSDTNTLVGFDEPVTWRGGAYGGDTLDLSFSGTWTATSSGSPYIYNNSTNAADPTGNWYYVDDDSLLYTVTFQRSTNTVSSSGFSGNGSGMKGVDAEKLGGSNPSEFVKTNSSQLVEPDGQTITVENQFLSTPSSIASPRITLLSTNLSLWTNAPFMVTNRVWLGTVSNWESGTFVFKKDTNNVLDLNFPELQWSYDGVTWNSRYDQATAPVIASLYCATADNSTVSNVVIGGWTNAFAAFRTNDFRDQKIWVRDIDSASNPSAAVNQTSSTNIANYSTSHWAGYPASGDVSFDNHNLTYNVFWSCAPATSFDGTRAALAWSSGGVTQFKLYPSSGLSGVANTNANIASFSTDGTNLNFTILSPTLTTAPTISYTTNLASPITWLLLTQATNWVDSGYWRVQATNPVQSSATMFFTASSATNSFATRVPVLEIPGAVRYNQQSYEPTALEIGGDATHTNIVTVNVSGVLKMYWSNGTTVWSKAL